MRKRTRTTTEPPRRRQRGIALILVLWTFAALAVLAAEFARAMHDEAASTRNFKESTIARMVAIAGLNEVILAMRADRKQPQTQTDTATTGGLDDQGPDPVHSLSHGDGQWTKASWHGVEYEARVIDEAGKLPLNFIKGDQMRTVFANLQISPADADIIADSIVDWIDPDDLHGQNGAESDYYEGLDRPYRAKNAPFDSVEELLLVRGVTRDIYFGHDDIPGLRDIFSVFNQSPTVNVVSMTPAVMEALGGIDPQAADDFVAARRSSASDAALEQLRTQIAASGVAGRTLVPSKLTIETKVMDASHKLVLAHIGAVINLGGGGENLWFERWYDSIFEDSEPSGASSGASDQAG
jgi:general secretion pathway protein K